MFAGEREEVRWKHTISGRRFSSRRHAGPLAWLRLCVTAVREHPRISERKEQVEETTPTESNASETEVYTSPVSWLLGIKKQKIYIYI